MQENSPYFQDFPNPGYPGSLPHPLSSNQKSNANAYLDPHPVFHTRDVTAI